MPKEAYIGVDNVARKVIGAHIGVNGVARKVKKMYIGDSNNVARLCWEEEKQGAWLIFTASEPFSISVANPGWDGAMQYSTDGETWNTWDGSEVSGTVIYIRGSGNTKVTGSNDSSYAWTITGSNVICKGNAETLLDHATVEAGEHPAMADHCYAVMFNGCTSLTIAPALPATTLSIGCYMGMFNGCTSLTGIPALPATTLPDYCYAYMFYDCSSLKFYMSGNYTGSNKYRVPTSGEATYEIYSWADMIYGTGGNYTGGIVNSEDVYLDSSCSIVE